uniref:glucan endo-1,3-beta-D-glucosidase n=1 Tax=Globisporangium ultimum (strain ATCC 200006 / CBS 805.95 / DAOM BR144) TaxID=431595 RepID=K3WJJ3_GLOUD
MLTPTSSMRSFLTLTALAVASSTADAGALSTGVCYSPWHHASVTADVVQADLGQVKQYFSSVRTYHAQFSGVNAIEMAAQAGVRIAVGIQMGDAKAVPDELKAACDGTKKHPEIVDAIYVGNENLVNGDFGTYTSAQLVDYIGQLRACIQNANIPIGTVQRINEWKVAASVGELAKVSDVIGVNIYPFFTNSDLTPIKRLEAQWAEINSLYPSGKVHLTETGWPRSGSPVAGNTPSKETAASFLKDYADWAKTQPTSYWFMMYDKKADGGADIENSFGICDTKGEVQAPIPSGDGSVTAVTADPTPSPVPSEATTPTPTTEVPATSADVPVGGYNNNSTAQKPNSSGGESESGDEEQVTPSPEPAGSKDDASEPQPETPSEPSPTPQVTPAATTPAPEKANKSKYCD